MTEVPNMLTKLGDIFAERNAVYGDDFLKHGKLMTILFPDGLELKTEDDFNRYALLKDIMTKISRYAPNFTQSGHQDSLDDLAVYSQMLQALDNIKRGGIINLEKFGIVISDRWYELPKCQATECKTPIECSTQGNCIKRGGGKNELQV